MARAQPIDDWHDTGERRETGDWNALRADLIALLSQVEQQMEQAGPSVADGRNSETGDDGRHRAALQSVNRALERFNGRNGDELSAAITQIRSRHQGLPQPTGQTRSPNAADELGAAVNGISERLERLSGAIQGGNASPSGLKEISAQLTQLTEVVEMLAGAVGETGQVKRLEAQIANITRMLTSSPRQTDSELGQRLDRLTSNIGQLTDLHKQLADGSLPQIDDLSAAQAKGLSSIEAGIRNVYERIDALESSYALNPADIEKLSAEMAAISSEMAKVTQYMKAGGVAGGTDTLLTRIDALNARVGQIEGDAPAVGGLHADLDSLRKIVQDALEPKFSAINSRLDALDKRAGGSRNAADISVSQLEAQIRQLVARMDQTGEQLTDIRKLYKDAGERDADGPDFSALADLVAKRTSPQFDALAERLSPDFDALADLVAERATEAVSRTAPPDPALSAGTLDEIEARMAKLFSAQSRTSAGPQEDFAGVHEGIRQVDERLARLETTLREKLGERADAAPAPADARTAANEPAQPVTPPAAASAKARPQPAADDAPARTRARKPRPDTMAANPHEDAPLIDRVRTADPESAVPTEPNRPAAAPAAAQHPAPGQTSQHEQTPRVAPRRGRGDQPMATPEPTAGQRPTLDPNAIERPRKPRSSYVDDAETLTSPIGRDRQADLARTSTRDGAAASASRNTFIEAARRAAQRQQAEQEAASSNSLIARAFARFQAGKSDASATPGSAAAREAAPAPMEADDRASRKARRAAEKQQRARQKAEAKAAARQEKTATRQEKAAASPPTADAAMSAPRVDDEGQDVAMPYGMEGLTAEDRTETGDERRGNLLRRYRQPLILAIAIVVAAALLVNLVEKQLHEQQPAAPAGQVATGQSTIAPAAHAPNAESITPTNEPAAGGDTENTSVKTQDMLDPEPTGSVDPFVRMAPEQTAALNQGLPPILSHAARTINESADGPMTTGSIDPSAAAPTTTTEIETNPETRPASGIALDPPPAKVGPQALRDAAANGDPRAQFEVAAVYSEGKLVPQDFTEAEKWYERAAAQGFAPAEYRLGNLYEHGKGVDKDLDQAQLWYQRAAEAGNRMAMHNLAALYASGDLGKQEFSQAAEWFGRAAVRGLTDSQFNLGMLYARGLGVPQNLQESYKWFSLAAASGDKGAAEARDDIAKSLDANAMKAAQAEVADFTRTPIDIKANFAPIGTWAKAFDPGKAITNKSVVERVQEALNGLGFDVGIPDGLMGPRTRDAISQFEKATGMSQSGAVNPRLLAVLGSQPV